MAISNRTCTIEGCANKHHSRGLCGMHALRLKRYGDPMVHGSRIVGDTTARFWSYIEDHSDKQDCWEWNGGKSPDGYGILRIDGGTAYMPRFAYELLIGPIADGLEPDHLCRNRGCVNPWHLEPVTHLVNILRGDSPQAVNARKTHCPQGHEYTLDNTRHQRKGGRLCRKCQSAHSTARRQRRRAEALAG